MGMDWGALGAAVVPAVCALIGVIWSNRKTETLIVYKIEQLTNRVNEHNKLIDRMYKAEERLKVLETKKGGD